MSTEVFIVRQIKTSFEKDVDVYDKSAKKISQPTQNFYLRNHFCRIQYGCIFALSKWPAQKYVYKDDKLIRFGDVNCSHLLIIQ